MTGPGQTFCVVLQEKLLVCLGGEVLDGFEIERKEPKMAADMHSRVYIRGRGPLLM